MEALHRQVAQARRRLVLGQFVSNFAWCLTAALLVAAIGLAIPKLFPLPVNGQIWAIAWICGAIAVGIVAAVIWTWAARRDSLFAAIEIDRRFGLKERVSSVLALSSNELQSDVGQALVSDAIRRIENADISGRFAVPVGRRNLLPLLPAVLVFGLTFFADKGRPSEAEATTTTQVAAQIHNSAEALRQKLAQQRKEAAEKGLQDAGDLFQKVERGIKELANKQGVDRKQALLQLNDLEKQLEARQKAVGSEDKLKQELGQMKDMQTGPADKLANALKNGRFQRALDELKKMEDSLKNDKLTAKDQAELAKQLEGMKQALDKMVQRHNQVQEDLKKQIAQFKNSGQTADAKRLQKQLSQLQQQQPQMDQLKQMAQKLGQCSGAMRAGKMSAASKAVRDMAKQVQDLKRQVDEQQMLDQSLDEIAECRAEMTKPEDGNCNGKCDAPGDWRPGDDERLGHEGHGGGSARATGSRPEKKTDFKFFDSKVGQKTGKGAAVVIGEADGPNQKGQVRAEIQAEIASSKHEDSDPLTGQHLQRSQRDFAKEYFDSVRDGN